MEIVLIKTGDKSLTPNGRPIQCEEDLALRECPHPYDPEL